MDRHYLKSFTNTRKIKYPWSLQLPSFLEYINGPKQTNLIYGVDKVKEEPNVELPIAYLYMLYVIQFSL